MNIRNKDLIDLFDQLNSKPIVVQTIYVKLLGWIAAALLAQIIYWAGTKKGKVFYKTNEEFCLEIFLGAAEFKAAKKKLVDLGIITVDVRGLPAKSFYTFNKEKLISLIINSIQLEDDQPVGRFSPNCDDNWDEEINNAHQLVRRFSSNQLGENRPTITENTYIDKKTSLMRGTKKPDFEEKISKEIEKKKPMSKQSPKTRIDPNLELSDEWTEIALREGIISERLIEAFQRFKNYWISGDAPKPLKSNWKMTWQNWCMDDVEKGKFIRPKPNSSIGNDVQNTQEINRIKHEIKKNPRQASNQVVEARIKILEHFGAETYKVLFEEMIISNVFGTFIFESMYMDEGTEAYRNRQMRYDKIYDELKNLLGSIKFAEREYPSRQHQ